jgi:hypothetical protein
MRCRLHGGLSTTPQKGRAQGETECAIVVQMAYVHSVTMAVPARLGGGHGGDRRILAAAATARRLSRTFAVLVETLRRLGNGGSQHVRVEHIQIESNSKASDWKLQENSER